MAYINKSLSKHPILATSKYSAHEMKANISHSWSLSPDYRDNLGIYHLIKTTVGELLDKINTDHAWIDYLTIPYNSCTLTCRVNYINGSYSYLQELMDKGKKNDICLVSVRMAKIMYPPVEAPLSGGKNIESISVALVLVNPEYIQIDKVRCYNLQGKEIV